MNWITKGVNVTVLDLILIAVIGGLILNVISKLIDFTIKKLKAMLEKPSKRFYRTLKEVRNIKKTKKAMGKGYDAKVYNLTTIYQKLRYLFYFERAYLKKYKEAHEENQRRFKDIPIENFRINQTPWK